MRSSRCRRAEADQVERLKSWRAGRDQKAVAAALKELRAAAQEDRNVMPASIACAKAGVTTGEWALRCTRASASTARRPASGARGATRLRRPRRHPRRRRPGLAQARPAAQIRGRQARTRRPLQRRRADRGARATPAWTWSTRASASRQRRSSKRASSTPTWSGCRSCPARTCRWCRTWSTAEDRRARRRAGRGRRHHPAGGRPGIAAGRRRRGLHPEGFRLEPHHGGHRADRG